MTRSIQQAKDEANQAIETVLKDNRWPVISEFELALKEKHVKDCKVKIFNYLAESGASVEEIELTFALLK